MKNTKKTLYTLYIDIPGGNIFSLGSDYYHGLWIARVRATNMREAYGLLNRQVAATKRTELGVTAIDNSRGPAMGWPWTMPKSLAPKNWEATLGA